MTRRQLLSLAALPLAAQDYLSSPRRAFTAPELKDAPDEWIDRSFRWVNDMLKQHPPALEEHPVRRAALIRLDDILHIESAPSKKLVQAWFQSRMDGAAREIATAKITRGARIWKVYNHTFFVRTPQSAFVFDLVPGQPRNEAMSMSKDTLTSLVSSAEALFISHYHDDHANPLVGELFFAQSKPVYGPSDIWRGHPELVKKLTVPERSASKVQDAGKFKLVAFPGHQGEPITNNCNLVRTPEGLTFMQMGDQSNDGDFQWIDQVAKAHKVDVLMPNCWTPEPLRMVKGIAPKLVLPGHENEMAHTVPHREDWTQTYNRFHGASAPVVALAWGESIDFGA